MKKKTTLFLAVLLVVCSITSVNCLAAITPADLSSLEQSEVEEDPIIVYHRIIPEMKNTMVKEFEETGDVIDFCITANSQEFVIEAFRKSDNFSGYQDSVFNTGMTRNHAKEFYTIMEKDAYEKLADQCEDETAIFAQLVTDPLKSMDAKQIAYALDKLDYPVIIQTYLFDGEYYLIKAAINEYVIQEGDTLFEIAVKFDTTVKNLAEINQIEDPNLIYVDRLLVIN